MPSWTTAIEGALFYSFLKWLWLGGRNGARIPRTFQLLLFISHCFPCSLEIGGMRSCWNAARSQARRHTWAALVMTSLERSSRMRVRRWDEIWDHSWISPEVSGSYHSQVPQKKVGPATLFFTYWRFPPKKFLEQDAKCGWKIHSKIQQNTLGGLNEKGHGSYPWLLNLETEDRLVVLKKADAERLKKHHHFQLLRILVGFILGWKVSWLRVSGS